MASETDDDGGGVPVELDDREAGIVIGDITPHMDGCMCEECCPPDWRPTPPTKEDYPACEPLLDSQEVRSLLRDRSIEGDTLSLPEPIKLPWGLYWSQVEIEWWLADAEWRSRRIEV